ncbi:PTS ascorbate transporter subunit IIC [Clostridium gasigenes]|uniref:PTS ascorbate transporter subunit IIC n=1 Tax=Clostridium gasigenes TaxID=94869 RepID=UPI0014383E3F|nr:PTS ascorbate transporter subunit IIC [Clostridium gasigenes]MBB6624477.1 PTS ascorbate transporter subunit IIC [Clostridium gasigenes]MBU3104276.1 PTS ascorbate transporter subunit IIC [Clostridium gasigenes]NKF06633.1 PTS ascorbate transporter subunit IIC [Clostridium gasigenes]QSW21016.1 PTS ascorbate transporter subunit IIC [Clostridium gasigenes]
MLDFIVDILSEPSVLVGVVALIGLVLQKKSFSDCISGTVKTIMGFLVLGGGAGIVVGSLEHFGKMFEHGFGITGIVPNNEAIVGMALDNLGTTTALIMAFGMVANILIARFTKLKYIFLTGHHTLYMACMFAAILYAGGITGTTAVIVGSILLGLTMSLMPAMAQPFMRKITGTDEVGFGHFGTFGYVLSALVGKVVGKGSKSTEEIKFPQSLTFLRDTSVAISITMLALFLIVAFAAGPEFVAGISGGKNLVVFALIQSITFAGGVFIILAGVRLILGEIVPAFRGIAMKLVPNAKPALDCPVVFPYAPNAVLIGFLCSFLGGLVGLFILITLGAPAILPGVVPHFFCGATAGVFGNATGGRRGAIFGSFANGLLITFLPALLLPVLAGLGFGGTTFSDADFGVIGVILGKVLSMFGA